jgi:hypothetical protein
MELAEIEAALGQNLEDLRYWAVYADALEVTQQLERATAIRQALKGPLCEPGPPARPLASVQWYCGHWLAAKVPADKLRSALSQPVARFLQHLIVEEGEGERRELELDQAPATLSQLELRVRSRRALQGADVLLARLQVLRCPELELPRLPDVPALVELEAASLPEPPASPWPRLQRLTLTHLPGLESWPPSLAPSLHTLRLRRPLAFPDLERLLGSPIGRQLRRLELIGSRALVQALQSTPTLWEHLERLVVDDDEGGSGRADGKLQVRTRLGEEGFGGEPTSYLRLAPPATALHISRALRQAARGLELHTEVGWEGEWIQVPRQVVLPLARWMAAREGVGAQVLQLEIVTHGSRLDLDAHALEVTPDGFERRLEFDLTRAEVYFDAEEHGDDDVREVADLFEFAGDLVGELFSHTRTETADFWVPPGWRPDPYALFRASASPRRLTCGSRTLEIEAELGAYVAFRAREGGGLELSPVPELARWVERLLRRHRLEHEPTDPQHPYWADWERLTRSDRLLGSSPGTVPHYKLLSAGRWLLGPEEVENLLRALRKGVEYHQVPPGLEPRYRPLLQWLSGTEAEVEVRVEA